MRAALINPDGVVTNVIAYEPGSDYEPPGGLSLVSVEAPVNIGDHYDGEVFTPAPTPTTPVEFSRGEATAFAARSFVADQVTTGTLDYADVPKVVALFPAWESDTDVAVDQVYSYGGDIYVVAQAHTTQDGWTPDVTPALYDPYRDPNAIEAWVQPDSTNPYPKGVKVTHEGKTWVSDIDGNVWEPPEQWTEAP